MSLSKERRDELRDDIHDSIEAAFLGGNEAVDGELAELSLYELRALLDMADERDRYRALLEEAVDRVNDRLDAEENVGGAGERFDAWIDRIDAALEGEHD